MRRAAPLVLATVCLLPACSQATAPSSREQLIGLVEEGPLVVFLGDSITAGMGVAGEEAFPAVVAELLREEDLPIRALNAGVSGDTAAGGLSRLDPILEQRPDVLVVELGANDALRGRPVLEIEEALRAIVGRAREADAEVLLLGMQVPPALGSGYAESFSGMYRRIAGDMDVSLVESFLEGVGGRRSMNQVDGIHPNAEGHRRLASNVSEPLQEIVEAIGR